MIDKQTLLMLVITPEDVGFPTSEENEAVQLLAQTIFALVNFVQDCHPGLYRHEAMILTIAVLNELFTSIQQDPRAIAEIKQLAEEIIQARS
ncbi:hypothetical protein OGM63_16550 [Plectonema radiosum NIES-515]|uniref:Cell division protein ZapA n=1 Tax=Plectonema radiosum NIES-515 TaxID=2986073 RepID=A0ABT3B161_9CYAN|nr:hypothetical protein [Plectonema radiosum]MCV3215103.1 hypothetical protein [Plectonema radiosum NIES-515]